MDGAALGLGALGLLTTLSAPLLAARHTARYLRSARVQEQLTELFTDALVYAQDCATALERVAEEYELIRRERAAVQHADNITARMRLLASDNVRTAWEGMLRTQDLLASHYLEDRRAQPVPADDEWLVKAWASVNKVYEVIRTAFSLRPR